MVLLIDHPTHTLTYIASADPLLESLMCYHCKFLYNNGSRPTHCDYYLLAHNLWSSGGQNRYLERQLNRNGPTERPFGLQMTISSATTPGMDTQPEAKPAAVRPWSPEDLETGTITPARKTAPAGTMTLTRMKTSTHLEQGPHHQRKIQKTNELLLVMADIESSKETVESKPRTALLTPIQFK